RPSAAAAKIAAEQPADLIFRANLRFNIETLYRQGKTTLLAAAALQPWATLPARPGSSRAPGGTAAGRDRLPLPPRLAPPPVAGRREDGGARRRSGVRHPAQVRRRERGGVLSGARRGTRTALRRKSAAFAIRDL